jgi:hypothetical protein
MFEFLTNPLTLQALQHRVGKRARGPYSVTFTCNSFREPLVLHDVSLVFIYAIFLLVNSGCGQFCLETQTLRLGNLTLWGLPRLDARPDRCSCCEPNRQRLDWTFNAAAGIGRWICRTCDIFESEAFHESEREGGPRITMVLEPDTIAALLAEPEPGPNRGAVPPDREHILRLAAEQLSDGLLGLAVRRPCR